MPDEKADYLASPPVARVSQKAQLVQLQGLIFRTLTYNNGTATGTSGDEMQLNEAISARLTELLSERGMTQYQLYMKSGVPKSTIGNVINCSYDSVKLRIIHEMCQGFEINISDFFNSPLFEESNLEP